MSGEVAFILKAVDQTGPALNQARANLGRLQEEAQKANRGITAFSRTAITSMASVTFNFSFI